MDPNRWRLDGQLALVTGGSAGIGLAIVRELLGFGADVLAVAHKTKRVVVQNLAWAAAYNLAAIPAAVLGLVDPLFAAIGMAASSLIVVANAARAAHPVLWRRSSADEAAPLRSAPNANAATGAV